MTKVLLTGSNGLLGQKLVKLLTGKRKEYELIATGRGENRNPGENRDQYTYLSLDITDPGAVKKTVAELKPDFIINTAAMTNVDQCEEDKDGCWKNNVEAVKNLVAACEENNTFLIHLSTDFIFDGADGPYPEEAIANPVSYYGESKLAAEEIIQKSNIKWAIARTVLVYGIAHDMSRSNIILWVKNSLESGKNIQVVNDQWRTPTLAEDLAMGCFLIMKNKAEGIFNISGKDFLSPYDMAIMTADFFKLDKSLITESDGTKFKQTAKRPPKTGFIIEKAEKKLGYKPHTFQEGIKVLSEQLAKHNASKVV
jgi:dTDP-4-dehydrorhamnose reductase